jgi:hypothetical protein
LHRALLYLLVAFNMTMATVMTMQIDKKRREDGGGGRRASTQPAPVVPAVPSDGTSKTSCFGKIMTFLNGTFFQTALYIAFVVVFQGLLGTMRRPNEFLFDKHVMDRIVENHFDSSHNTFESVRRIADIYEWGNQVFWPGLFGDLGPCTENVGSLNHDKACVDDAWPDGEGSFALEGASPYGLDELVQRMDQFDWTEGITFRQVRAKASDCPTSAQLSTCYPELVGLNAGDTASFGYNYTHPGQPLTHAFTHLTESELGSDPGGMNSAAIPSMKTHETAGFAALVIPFFSDSWLEYEEGPAAQVTDYRRTYVNTTNGRVARFYCVRTSTNGLHIQQLCDPGTRGNGTGALTGAVRAHVEFFWNELKRSHYLDTRSRVFAIIMQLRSNYAGVRYRITLMFELTSLGAILPSYDVETRVLDSAYEELMVTYATIGFGMVIFFCVLEGVELWVTGWWKYASDLWNIMDWFNFIIFFLLYATCKQVEDAVANPNCSSYMCEQVGYFDDWKLMKTMRSAKMYLSLCVCVQLFKILKFASALVPKMGLATNVLRKCCNDLLFFGFVFAISMLAFSMMLYVQVGNVMESYRDQFASFVALSRALFGDFDIDDIMDNSYGYLNALLFIGYLFVAIFIMLSMFLAILAEGQGAVRDDEREVRDNNPDFKEYGVIDHTYTATRNMMIKIARRTQTAQATSETTPSAAGGDHGEVTTGDVLEAVMALREEVASLREANVAAKGAATHARRQGRQERRAGSGLAAIVSAVTAPPSDGTADAGI